MLTIISDNFPTARTVGYGASAGLVNSPAAIVGAESGAYQEFENPAIQVEETIAVPSYVDEVFVTLPVTTEGNTIDDLSRITIGNTTYVPESAQGASVAGTFAFNRATQTLTVYPSATSPPLAGETIRYVAIQNKTAFYDDVYNGPSPNFFRRWNVSGPVSFQRSLGQSPSGSLRFLVEQSSFNAADLKEGTTFTWDGEAYGVGGVSAELNPLDGAGLLEVTVDLQGPHDHLLNNQVRYRGSISNPQGTETGRISLTGSDSEDTKSQVDIDFARLCTRAGLDYIGPSLDIRIDRDRDPRDSTSIGNELGRARAVEAVAYLSNPNGLEFRPWFDGVKTHNVGSGEILNGSGAGNSFTPYEIEYSISGSSWNGVCLAAEYLNTELRVDDFEGGDRGENGRVNIRQTLRSGSALKGNTVVWLPPSGIDRSVPTAAFDQGGPTLDYVVETRLNGRILSREKTIYGYAYKTSDFVTFQTSGGVTSPIFPAPEQQPRLQGWGQVTNEVERYIYDSDGYLVRIEKEITTKRRFKQETSQRETLQLFTLSTLAESTDATLQSSLRSAYAAALDLYTYFDVTEVDTTEFTLEDADRLYPNLPAREDNEPIRQYVGRVDREYRATYQTSDLSSIRVDDAGNAVVASQRFADPSGDFFIDVDGLTVSTGVDYREVLERTVIYPLPGTTEERYDEDRNRYTESETITYATGENLKNVDNPAPVTREFSGTVPFAERLERFEDGNDPGAEDEPEDESITLMNTPNNGLDPSSDPINGSASFPSTYNKTTALAAAIVDISIANTAAVEVWNGVLVAPIRQYQVGDRVRYRGVNYRVLSVVDEPVIVGSEIRRGPLQLSWGREVDLRNNVTTNEVD